MRKTDALILIVITICMMLAFGAGVWLGYKIAYDKDKPFTRPKTVVKINYFQNGDTLFPNVICQDTQIVINAAKLNDDMALIEQGYWDADEVSIDSLYHANCRSLNP